MQSGRDGAGRTDGGRPASDLGGNPPDREVRTPSGGGSSVALFDRALYALFARHADRERHRRDRRNYRGADLRTGFE
ncbi:MAG: hypothetical protein ABEJ34_07625, partial [Haloferacaceae archaeon]